ncbi:hypothetical protein [Agaribacterium sp. ZY112]|uniref:hypothetical protein n=1 Tax=Agaribacterium sp. ZY112 TaxID=3233574 RepID=UPI0035251605
MKFGLIWLLVYSVVFIAAKAYAEPPTLRFGMPVEYHSMLATWIEGNAVSAFEKGSVRLIDRTMAEQLIVIRALKVAGFKHKSELISIPSIQRAAAMAKQGRIDLLGTSYWSTDPNIDDIFIRTDTYIKQGEALVGFFTASNNKYALASKSKDELSKLSYVVVKDWHIDIKTLKKYKHLDIHQAEEFRYLMRALEAHHADVALLEFQRKGGLGRFHWDMKNKDKPEWVFPIANFKTYLDGERLFLISKKSPWADELLEAMNEGLALMRESGELRQLLVRAGYYPEEVDNWKEVDLSH